MGATEIETKRSCSFLQRRIVDVSSTVLVIERPERRRREKKQQHGHDACRCGSPVRREALHLPKLFQPGRSSAIIHAMASSTQSCLCLLSHFSTQSLQTQCSA